MRTAASTASQKGHCPFRHLPDTESQKASTLPFVSAWGASSRRIPSIKSAARFALVCKYCHIGNSWYFYPRKLSFHDSHFGPASALLKVTTIVSDATARRQHSQTQSRQLPPPQPPKKSILQRCFRHPPGHPRRLSFMIPISALPGPR